MAWYVCIVTTVTVTHGKPPDPCSNKSFFVNFSRFYEYSQIKMVQLCPYASFNIKLFWFDFYPLQVTPNRNHSCCVLAPGGSLSFKHLWIKMELNYKLRTAWFDFTYGWAICAERWKQKIWLCTLDQTKFLDYDWETETQKELTWLLFRAYVLRLFCDFFQSLLLCTSLI